MARLPQPGSDAGQWGEILNDYLSQSLSIDGSLNVGTVGSVQLKPNAVTTAAITDGSITTAKIADGSITSEKLSDSYAPLASPGFTGTPTGITKAHVGLGDVDNTSDASKPISTAQAIAFASKVSLTSLPVIATPIAHGVDPSGVADSTAGLQAAIDEAYASVVAAQKAANNDSVNIPIKRDVEIPAGLYKINSSIVLKQGVNLHLSHAAVIRAGTVMAVMLDSSPTVLLQRSTVSGGVWDCNALAETAIYLRWGIAMTLRDLRINDPTKHAIIVGDPSATSSSYEVTVSEIDMYRPRGTTAPAGYAGLWMRTVTDSWVNEIVPRGFDVGIRNDGGNNSFFRCHPWNPTGSLGPGICFDDNGSNSRWIDCYADSPSGIGFRFRGSSSYEMTNCTMYMSASGPDNTAYGVQCDGAPNLIIVGGTIYGADASHRWKQDVYVTGGGPSSLNIKFMARSDSGTVVTRNFGLRFSMHALSLTPGTDPGAVQVNGGTGDHWRGYNASGLVSVINANGGLQPGNGTTVGGAFYSGSGAPSAGLGANGDAYWRTDTPTTANQRLYIRASGAWTGIL